MTTTTRPLTDAELKAAIAGKARHLHECKHAHRSECAEMTWLEIDAMLEALHEQG